RPITATVSHRLGPMERIMPNRLKALAAFVPLIAGPFIAQECAAAPTYTANGELVPPADYREWVYMSTGLDMSYNERALSMGHSMFDNVFVDPASWAQFKLTGHWPDKAMFVLEVRKAESHGSINKKGQF